MAFFTIFLTALLTRLSPRMSSPASETTFLTAFFTDAVRGCSYFASTLAARSAHFANDKPEAVKAFLLATVKGPA